MNAAAAASRLILVELGKMRRQRLTAAVLGLPAVAAALGPQALRLSGTEEDQGLLALATALELALLLGAFLLFLQAALLVVGERAEKTLRDTLVGPVRRGDVLLARWGALLVELVVLVALVSGLALASTALRFRFDDITAEAVEPLFLARDAAAATLRGVLYFLPPAAALVSFGLLISVLASAPATAAALALGVLLLLDVGKSLLHAAPWMPRVFFNAYLPTLFDHTSYIHGAAKLAEGMSDVLWPDDSPLHRLNLIVPAVYALAFLLISILVFARKEFAE